MLRLFIAVSRLFDNIGTHIELGSVGIVYGMSLECHPEQRFHPNDMRTYDSAQFFCVLSSL